MQYFQLQTVTKTTVTEMVTISEKVDIKEGEFFVRKHAGCIIQLCYYCLPQLLYFIYIIIIIYLNKHLPKIIPIHLLFSLIY